MLLIKIEVNFLTREELYMRGHDFKLEFFETFFLRKKWSFVLFALKNYNIFFYFFFNFFFNFLAAALNKSELEIEHRFLNSCTFFLFGTIVLKFL